MSTTTYGERISRLANKLDALDIKIGDLQNQRDQITTEIQSMVSGTSNKTTTRKAPAGSMGDRIVSYLATQGSKTLEAIANALKIEKQRVSLSIYHLTQKGRVTQTDGLYSAVASAKSDIE